MGQEISDLSTVKNGLSYIRRLITVYLPVWGEGGSSFGVLPFSDPVVVLLPLLVKDVCDSLLGNPSLVREKMANS